MTAVPLTLEDLERLEQRAIGNDRSLDDMPDRAVLLVLAGDLVTALASLRSVMAERDALAEWKAEARREWERFLRAPTDAESDEGSKALDRLMEAP